MNLLENLAKLGIYDDNSKVYTINNEKTTYLVYTDGSVYSIRNDKLKKMKPVKQKHGYYLVHLHFNGKSYYRWLHRMVAECFIENKDNKPEVNHIDGDKSNNRVENLEWVTCKENIEHAFRSNLRGVGERAANAKLTEKQVRKICEMLEDNYLTMREISEIIGCNYHQVFEIKTKKSWTHVSCDYNFDHYNKFEPNRGANKLSEQDVREICDLIQSKKYTCRYIATLYGVHENAIYLIKSKKCWKDITEKIDFS